MKTTHLFVTATVKQLLTGGSFRTLLPFFLTSQGVGVLNSAIFNGFHNRVEFGTILEGLHNFGGGGWDFSTPNPLPPSSVRHWLTALQLLSARTNASDTIPTRCIGKTSNKCDEERAEHFQCHESRNWLCVTKRIKARHLADPFPPQLL